MFGPEASKFMKVYISENFMKVYIAEHILKPQQFRSLKRPGLKVSYNCTFNTQSDIGVESPLEGVTKCRTNGQWLKINGQLLQKIQLMEFHRDAAPGTMTS